MRDGKPLILCVDDDQDLLDGLRVQLEARGYSVVTEHSGEDGVRTALRDRPDLLVVDLMMEEVDSGTRVARDLRLHGFAAPIVLLTSVGDSFAVTADPEAMGLAAVLQKPVDPRVLDGVIRARVARPRPA